MRKFIAVAGVACCLALSLWANPAQAQLLRGERLRGMRSERTAYYSGPVYADTEVNNSVAVTVQPTDQPTYRTRTRGLGLFARSRSRNAYSTPVSTPISSPMFIYGTDMSTMAGTRSGITRTTFYQPPAGGTQAAIEVLLPDPNAHVSFDGTMTEEQGMDRLFTSPPLEPSKIYTYTVKLMWMDNGKEVNRSLDVRVQGGRTTLVDCRGPGDIRELKGPLPLPQK